MSGVHSCNWCNLILFAAPDMPREADGSPVVPNAAEGTRVGTVIATTTTITVVLEENIFVHDNGELLSYTIIVAEADGRS